MACANELGLDTPYDVQSEATIGLAPDLDEGQTAALVAYVATLPEPVDDGTSAAGEATFDALGCTACHLGRLGRVVGAYTDLLVHDLGPTLADRGSGYGSGPVARVAEGAAGVGEWRTPPLWGVRDSGPWLHDGRARTLDAAIRAHGGEATDVTARYGRLPEAERRALVLFLNGLVAPGSARVTARDG